MSDEPLYISVTTNEKDRTITIFDSGIGMSKQEVIDNLGTIAKSGSQEFVKSLGEGKSDNIIGQFGVGFYSTFIVASNVEVITKNENSKHAVRWLSDGSGHFEIFDVEGVKFNRGTQIKLTLTPESRNFSQPREVEAVLKKFSLFITYPIKLNGEVINQMQAIWYRDKREVSDDEYEKFYENVAKTKIPYKFRLHYATDVPLSIKSLLYFPSTNNEKYNPVQEKPELHLYSRKVLIKQNCQELLPSYLRFVKGVVDCEDLPLNISRENYQDSSLIAKLKNVMTRRVLKALEDEMKLDEEKYNNWFGEFSQNIKEGLLSDFENSQQLLKICRYKSTFTGELCSLDDYVKKMKPEQKKIYFLVQ